ncbi:MAG: hypothetical protein JW973_18565 [Bacteroidales bacterium]|nr:hypothetical protein [Bacteroidales bacterium]
MKKIFVSSIIAIIGVVLFAQAPEMLNYQAVVRNSSGELIKSVSVNFRISILQGTETGTAVYTETHNATTNAQGLVNLKIGNGTSAENFADINWSSDAYFLKVEMDPAGGTSYSHFSTTQLLSVPYALYSKNADMLDGNSSSFYRNADNINAGTLDNARFSAYGDLGDEGHLDNNAAADILTREQADGRFITGITTSSTSGLDGGATEGTATLTVDPTDFNAIPKSVFNTTTVWDISNTYTTIASTSITIPRPGYVVAVGGTTPFFSNKSVTNNQTNLYLGVVSTSGGTPANYSYGEIEYNADGNGHPAESISVVDVMYFGTSGSKTIYLKLRTGAAEDLLNALHSYLTIFFIPE